MTHALPSIALDKPPLSQADALAAHLRQHARIYFPELKSARVRLVSARKRAAAVFYRFRLGDASDARAVLVKALSPQAEAGREGRAAPERPRASVEPTVETKFQLECAALALIWERFGGRKEPRFGAIRLLDILPEHLGLVMDDAPDPSLSALFAGASRFRFPPRRMELAAFRNAGAWLRAYHAIPRAAHAGPRNARRRDFVEMAVRAADYLARTLGDAAFFGRTASALAAGAQSALPRSLPLGLAHGDYALRNLLVGPGGRITVLDTRARWRAPIYEDIAYFLAGFKTTGLQSLSQGLAYAPGRLAECEREFLGGYFEDEPIPSDAIRLYEIFVLLDKWSGVVSRNGRQVPHWRILPDGLRTALWSRFLRRSVESLLREQRPGS